jgi:hypothetical protein
MRAFRWHYMMFPVAACIPCRPAHEHALGIFPAAKSVSCLPNSKQMRGHMHRRNRCTVQATSSVVLGSGTKMQQCVTA